MSAPDKTGRGAGLWLSAEQLDALEDIRDVLEEMGRAAALYGSSAAYPRWELAGDVMFEGLRLSNLIAAAQAGQNKAAA